MRSDHPDPAVREVIAAEDLLFAELLGEYLTGNATAAARERFWIRAVDQLGPSAACRLNAAIALYQALASPSTTTPTEGADPMPQPPARVRLLHGDEADIFREHDLALRLAVRRRAFVSDQVVEDACAFAWLQFLRRQPDRATAFAWLRTVAVREAWRLSTLERRDIHLEASPAWQDTCGATSDASATAITRSLPPPAPAAPASPSSSHEPAPRCAPRGRVQRPLNPSRASAGPRHTTPSAPSRDGAEGRWRDGLRGPRWLAAAAPRPARVSDRARAQSTAPAGARPRGARRRSPRS